MFRYFLPFLPVCILSLGMSERQMLPVMSCAIFFTFFLLYDISFYSKTENSMPFTLFLITAIESTIFLSL